MSWIFSVLLPKASGNGLITMTPTDVSGLGGFNRSNSVSLAMAIQSSASMIILFFTRNSSPRIRSVWSPGQIMALIACDCHAVSGD